MHAGLANVGKTPVLSDGLRWQRTGLSSVDAEWLATRRYQVEEICRMCGVPPFMVGHTDKTTSWGSGIEQQLLGFLIFTMRPWLAASEQAIRRDLITAPHTYSAEFNVEGLLSGDSKARAALYASAIQNLWMSPNEVREREGLNPRDGGDQYQNPNVAGRRS